MRAMPSFFAGNQDQSGHPPGSFLPVLRARSLRRPPEQPPQRRKILFESLEPRLLLSADFNPVAPVGSLIHQASENGELAGASATASYTLALDAEQKISVVFSTTDADLRGTIELYDPDNNLLGSDSAGNPGEMALLDSVAAGDAGDYRLDVRNLAGEGAFAAKIILNAAAEQERAGGSDNNTIASPQELAASAINLPAGFVRHRLNCHYNLHSDPADHLPYVMP